VFVFLIEIFACKDHGLALKYFTPYWGEWGGVAYRGEGITSVKFILVPCGVNVPHTHPRATEVLNVVAGGPLLVGWVNTSGSKSFDQYGTIK
jgi:hypothetical protein